MCSQYETEHLDIFEVGRELFPSLRRGGVNRKRGMIEESVQSCPEVSPNSKEAALLGIVLVQRS